MAARAEKRAERRQARIAAGEEVEEEEEEESDEYDSESESEREREGRKKEKEENKVHALSCIQYNNMCLHHWSLPLSHSGTHTHI